MVDIYIYIYRYTYIYIYMNIYIYIEREREYVPTWDTREDYNYISGFEEYIWTMYWESSFGSDFRLRSRIP